MSTLDRTGKKYGPRARAMRAVLHSIANAANAEGENAHPGLPAMIDESLYAKASVMRTIDELVAEHWLEVTEVGRGRGHATVYRILMDREKVSLRDLSSDGKGLIRDKKRSHSEAEKVSSSDSAPLSLIDATKTNIPPAGDTPLRKAAHALAVLAFEQPVKPTIANANGKAFVAVLGLFETALRAGRPVQEIERAIFAGIDVWTTQGVNTSLAKIRGRKIDPVGDHFANKFDSEGKLVK